MPIPHSSVAQLRRSLPTWWWASLSFLFFLILGLTVIVLQKQLRLSQENRGRATSAQGIVEITPGAYTFQNHNQSVLFLTVNTHGANVGEIAVNFRVILPAGTTSTPSAIEAVLTPQNSNLIYKSGSIGIINGTANPDDDRGWQVSAVFTPVNTTTGFTSGQSADSLLRFEFKLPETTGQLDVIFDQNSSHAYTWSASNTQPPEVLLDILMPVFQITRDIQDVSCTYSYATWGACNNGLQVRTATFPEISATCPTPETTMLQQACFPQCTYSYSDWGTCTNGWQNRSYSVQPTNCTWYQTETLQPLTQQCNSGTNASTDGFSVYTYETCWADRSEGGSTYLMWDKTKYAGATKIDVSTTSDFASYANKDVSGTTDTIDGKYLVTNGTNFRTYTDGKQSLWVFWPGYTYYFRLFYTNGSTGVITYFVPKCAGTGGVNYKQCNETCTSNNQCATNLTCSSGVCRRAGNTTSENCSAPPDSGLNRACNDYCADKNECQSGLTCWWNRCRNPKNLDNTSCQNQSSSSSSQTSGSVVYVGSSDAASASSTPELSCDDTCNTNRDCAVNLRCYQNRCRLPSNVTSQSCLTAEAEAEAEASKSAQPRPTAAPTPKPSVNGFESLPQWLIQIGSWLADRLGFLVLGLLVVVFVLMIWPLMKPNAPATTTTQVTPVTPVPPVAPVSPTLHQPITQVMKPATPINPVAPSSQETTPRLPES